MDAKPIFDNAFDNSLRDFLIMHKKHDKDKSVSFPLPEIKDAMDASQAASSVLTAVSNMKIKKTVPRF